MMTKEQMLKRLSDASYMIRELQEIVVRTIDDDGRKIKRPLRKKPDVDGRLFLPYEELPETLHVKRALAELQASGRTVFQSRDVLDIITSDRRDHNPRRKAVLRHILTGMGYEYVTVRIDEKTSKSWRLK